MYSRFTGNIYCLKCAVGGLPAKSKRPEGGDMMKGAAVNDGVAVELRSAVEGVEGVQLVAHPKKRDVPGTLIGPNYFTISYGKAFAGWVAPRKGCWIVEVPTKRDAKDMPSTPRKRFEVRESSEIAPAIAKLTEYVATLGDVPEPTKETTKASAKKATTNGVVEDREAKPDPKPSQRKKVTA